MPGEPASSATPALTRRQAWRRARNRLWLHAVLIGGALLLSYSNTFSNFFIFDDIPGILENKSIKQLFPIWQTLWPPKGLDMIARCRPVMNLSLALNYALSGEEPWSYHAVNLIIHLLASLTLLGIIRRVLVTDALRDRFGSSAEVLAAICALLWALHPLQTQAVTYVVQRCESQMGLFFLLTVYCALRSWQSPVPRLWQVLAAGSCLLGAGTKEVMAVAPLLVLLLEVVLMDRSVAGALRASAVLYAGLAVAICFLGFLVSSGWLLVSIPKEETVPLLGYLLTQPQVIVHYLGLALWPADLCLDYAWPVVDPLQALPALVLIVAALALTVTALLRHHLLSLPLVWFFAILAPTSLVPLPDLAFEHRMYLPLAAVVLLIVLGAYRGLDALDARTGGRHRSVIGTGGVILTLVIAVCLGARTYLRNRDYRDAYTMWTKTVRQRPDNANALAYLAQREMRRGELSRAVALLRRAVAVDPNHAKAHRTLGWALGRTGAFAEAIEHYRLAVQMRSYDPGLHHELALLLMRTGHTEEAISEYQETIRRSGNAPDKAVVYYNLGCALEAVGRVEEARHHLASALRLRPDFPAAREALDRIGPG